MRTTRLTMTIGIGTLLMAGVARSDQAVAPGCAKIVAVLDESGGALSADEIAKKTDTDVETVRSCTDTWRAGMKDGSGKAGKDTAMPPGCAKVVGVLDANPGLSPDEVATKSGTDAETVRNCTDLWRKTMKQ